MGHKGNVESQGTFARLGSLPQYHPMSDADIQLVTSRAREMLQRDNRAAAKLSASILRIQTCARTELPDVVRTTVREHLLPPYPYATTWLVRVDPALSMRFAAVRALLMMEEDPSLLVSARSRPSEGMVFESARGLLGDTTFGMAAYITPLLLAQSLWTIGVAAPRNGGVVVLMLGESVRGQTGIASELLQLFHPHGDGVRAGPAPTSARQHEAAMVWWTRQLDQLFTEVTDPCNYRLLDETFNVRAQFETLLGLEQAFRNLQSILAGDRDAHAGRLACLDTLDTLEGLRIGLDFRAMSRLPMAERALSDIRDSMPEEVRPVLLPKAEAAVRALRQLQDGFFDSPRRTRSGIKLPNKQGVDVEISLADATASWIRLLRNAGHSFRTRDGGSGARDDALLLAHNGVVPSSFSGLAYLYLLRLVARPHYLRNARSDGRHSGPGSQGGS